MFIRIKENKLYDWAGYKFADDAIYVDIDYKTFEPEKYGVIDGILTDISQTQEYVQTKAQEQRQIDVKNLKVQIDELDIKRIRAMAEPQIKDEATGQTWLEFYNQQICNLRNQLAIL